MRKTYVAIMAILVMILAACRSEEISTLITEPVSVIETTEATESTTVPTEPAVETTEQTEPPEKTDMQALIEYSREYAASIYGYEVSIGLWDGCFPADDYLIHTMEDGYHAVRISGDYTARMLLARPSVQIVTEIDGVLC